MLVTALWGGWCFRRYKDTFMHLSYHCFVDHISIFISSDCISHHLVVHWRRKNLFSLVVFLCLIKILSLSFLMSPNRDTLIGIKLGIVILLTVFNFFLAKVFEIRIVREALFDWVSAIDIWRKNQLLRWCVSRFDRTRIWFILLNLFKALYLWISPLVRLSKCYIEIFAQISPTFALAGNSTFIFVFLQMVCILVDIRLTFDRFKMFVELLSFSNFTTFLNEFALL